VPSVRQSRGAVGATLPRVRGARADQRGGADGTRGAGRDARDPPALGVVCRAGRRRARRRGGECRGLRPPAGRATADQRAPTGDAGAEPARAAPTPPAPEASRSRGRTDWIFFFKTGDQLVRMSDEAPLGMVIRTAPKHDFADGTTGPAYLLQLPEGGGQRFVDADELERGGRLQ
jgi:hypothetical protein